jgi:hypothetical protein
MKTRRGKNPFMKGDMNSSPSNTNKCQETKPDGQQCRAIDMINSNFCFFHDPDTAKEREAARRAGGVERSRRAVVLPPDTPDRLLRNKRELADFLRDMINKIVRGELDPKIGYIVGNLTTLYTKTLFEADLEEMCLLSDGTVEERLAFERWRRERRRAVVEGISRARPIEPAAVPGKVPSVEFVNRSDQEASAPEDPEVNHDKFDLD